jgi:hypothetical protein
MILHGVAESGFLRIVVATRNGEKMKEWLLVNQH